MKKLVSRIILAALFVSMIPFQAAMAATQQEQVVEIAQKYIGVPYLYGGTTPSGFDCSGYIGYVYDEIGIELPRVSADQYTVGQAVSKADLKPGDLVFFEKTYNKAGITHSGIYIGDNQFMSATTSKGIKIDSLDSTYWGPKFYGAKRVLADASVPGQYQDVPLEHPAYQAVVTLSNQNVIKGIDSTSFQPEQPVTRGQAAAIINRVLKLKATSLNGFNDVASSYQFAADIAAIREAGVINGFADGSFRPNNNMTKAEMAVIVQRAFKLNQLGVQAANSTPYVDISPGYWAYEAILTMQKIDTTTIFAGNKYGASLKATRATFAASIYNSINAAN